MGFQADGLFESVFSRGQGLRQAVKLTGFAADESSRSSIIGQRCCRRPLSRGTRDPGYLDGGQKNSQWRGRRTTSFHATGWESIRSLQDRTARMIGSGSPPHLYRKCPAGCRGGATRVERLALRINAAIRKSYKRGCQETFFPTSRAAGILSGIQPPARSTALRLIVVGPPHQQRDIGLQSAVASCS